MLEDAFRRLLADHAGPQVARACEAGAVPEELGAALRQSGFLDLLVSEAAGGAGLSLADLFPLAVAAGRHLLAVPFAETVLARAWFPGVLAGDSLVVLAPCSPLVPMARLASHAVVREADGLALCPLRAAGDDPWRTGAATQLETGAPIAGAPAADLEAAAAALTAARIAGLVAGAAELAHAHVTTRQQFGRPLAAFQAIQQQMAELAEEGIAAHAAASLAFAGARIAPLAAALAKARASEAAAAGQAILHQVHGAIGMTAEYDLGLYTRRLQEARIAFGSESHWAARIADARLADRAGTAADFLRRHLDLHRHRETT
ncbi:MAG: acyl-CoA dehydrogenase family protein [Sphingomonadaceae bacterium]